MKYIDKNVDSILKSRVFDVIINFLQIEDKPEVSIIYDEEHADIVLNLKVEDKFGEIHFKNLVRTLRSTRKLLESGQDYHKIGIMLSGDRTIKSSSKKLYEHLAKYLGDFNVTIIQYEDKN